MYSYPYELLQFSLPHTYSSVVEFTDLDLIGTYVALITGDDPSFSGANLTVRTTLTGVKLPADIIVYANYFWLELSNNSLKGSETGGFQVFIRSSKDKGKFKGCLNPFLYFAFMNTN